MKKPFECRCQECWHVWWDTREIHEIDCPKCGRHTWCSPPNVGKKAGHPRFHELLKEIGDLHDKKNKDYAEGMKEGPLGNFVRVSKIMQLYPNMDWDSPFGVSLVYSLKQFDAALTLRSTKKNSVTGEPVEARLRDVAIYALLGIILEGEEAKEGFIREDQLTPGSYNCK